MVYSMWSISRLLKHCLFWLGPVYVYLTIWDLKSLNHKSVKQYLADLILSQFGSQFCLYAVYYYLVLDIIIQIPIIVLLLHVFFQFVDLVLGKICHVKFYKILHVKFLQNFCKILHVKFYKISKFYTLTSLTDFMFDKSKLCSILVLLFDDL